MSSVSFPYTEPESPHHQPQTNDVYLFYFNYPIIILPQPSVVAGRRPFQGQATPGNNSVLYWICIMDVFDCVNM